MALVLKMQIDDKQEHQYIFSTGDDGTIELIPLNVVANGRYQAPENKAYNLVTVEVPEITLEQLNVQTSGTYTAPSGTAYDVVTVDIPEYVLDALTATENGTFEPESGHVYNRVVVNVPPTEPDIQTKSVTYTANGTYIVNKDSGYDGMSSVTVTVNVPTPTPNLQTKTVTVTQNGTSAITADTGYDGLEEVGLTVNVPAPTPNLQTKNVTVTQNGTSAITADTGYDGLEEVALTVNVPTGGGGGNIFETDITPDSAGIHEIPLNYSGNGYPIMLAIVPYNNYKNSDYSALVRGGSVMFFFGYKNRVQVAPTYTNDSNTDQMVTTVMYKQGQHQDLTTNDSVISYKYVPEDYTIQHNSEFSWVFLTPTKLKLNATSATSTSNFGIAVGYKYRVIVVYSE